jgi:hypothetical protein
VNHISHANGQAQSRSRVLWRGNNDWWIRQEIRDCQWLSSSLYTLGCKRCRHLRARLLQEHDAAIPSLLGPERRMTRQTHEGFSEFRIFPEPCPGPSLCLLKNPIGTPVHLEVINLRLCQSFLRWWAGVDLSSHRTDLVKLVWSNQICRNCASLPVRGWSASLQDYNTWHLKIDWKIMSGIFVTVGTLYSWITVSLTSHSHTGTLRRLVY